MGKINLKLLSSLLKLSPSFLLPRCSTCNVISRVSMNLYHNGSQEHTEDEDHKSRINNFFERNEPFNVYNEENEFNFEGLENLKSDINSQVIQKEKKISNERQDSEKPNWQEMKLKPIKKNVYIYSPHIENQSTEEIENYRKHNNMVLHGRNIPNPILRISDYEFPKEVVKAFKNMGIETPTPIQAQGWPVVLNGYDFIGIGLTGSGKTLGYIVPGLVHILNQPPLEQGEGPIGLVLGPTRELLRQIYDVAVDMFTEASLKPILAHGGTGSEDKHDQILGIRNSPHICFATPLRMLQFLEMGAINLNRCTFLVLDEADEMLDMGFELEIREIIKQMRPDRQTLMWSATWPKAAQNLAHNFLDDFIQLNVGSGELYANPNIKQEIEVCAQFKKQERLVEKLKGLKKEHEKILIFAQTKASVEYLVKFLDKKGIYALPMHGDYTQRSREYVLDGFREGKYSIVVATDVAARGIDVKDITLVINYDFPLFIERYVHRIGRTGRAGKTGTSLTFITSSDNMKATKNLIKLLEKGNCEVPPSLYDLAKRQEKLKEMEKRSPSYDPHRYSRFRNNPKYQVE